MRGIHLYRFEPACENRIRSLRDKKLWLSNPASFNDPFDSSANKKRTLHSINMIKMLLESLLKRSLMVTLTTKHSDWSYEQEIHFIKDNTFTSEELRVEVFGKKVDMPNGLEVTWVIAGLKISNTLKESLSCTAECLQIPMYCIKTDNQRGKYSMNKTLYGIQAMALLKLRSLRAYLSGH